MKGLPKRLNEIPLEYFKKGLRWLGDQPGFDPDRLGIVGKYRGGEVALVLGAIYPEIKAVVAYAPSHVVWPGTGRGESSWTFSGRPIPFIEFSKNLAALKRFVPKEVFNCTLCWTALENRHPTCIVTAVHALGFAENSCTRGPCPEGAARPLVGVWTRCPPPSTRVRAA